MDLPGDRPRRVRALAVSCETASAASDFAGGCMSLIKRKKSSVWWIDFVAPNGERIRRSTETADRKEAAELHDKRMLRWLHRSLADRELESINRTLVEAIIEAKQAEGCSN